MKTLGGAVKRRKGYLVLLVTLLTVCLMLPGPTPGFCKDTFTSQGQGDNTFWAAMGIFSVLGATAIGYGLYETKMRPDQPRLLDGEFYVAGLMGASFAASQKLKYNNGAFLNNGTVTATTGKFTLSNNQFSPGVVGGLKFGYFFKSIPYLGLEGETNVAPNRVRNQVVRSNVAIQGTNRIILPNKDWINWTSALHIVARYGFFKDSEVPFGRLQPYVGVGPAVVAMYDPDDSAKNFAIDVMGGIRFMMLKNVSAFVEYKYNHQFDTEMEIHQFGVTTAPVFSGRGTASLPYDLHRVVLGVSYHF